MPATDAPAYTLGMAYAMANWKMTDRDTLNAGTGFAMRPPSLAELYSDEPYVPVVGFGNSFLEGNSTLKPERVWQVDLGMTSVRGPFRYGARGYYSTIWDYIMPAPAYIVAPATSSHALGRNFSFFPAAYREDLGTPAENGDTCRPATRDEHQAGHPLRRRPVRRNRAAQGPDGLRLHVL